MRGVSYWLTTFTDLALLLIAFFVMQYATQIKLNPVPLAPVAETPAVEMGLDQPLDAAGYRAALARQALGEAGRVTLHDGELWIDFPAEPPPSAVHRLVAVLDRSAGLRLDAGLQAGPDWRGRLDRLAVLATTLRAEGAEVPVLGIVPEDIVFRLRTGG